MKPSCGAWRIPLVETWMRWSTSTSCSASSSLSTSKPYFETRSLAAIRATLLPKLIFGELRVTNAERCLKEQSI